MQEENDPNMDLNEEEIEEEEENDPNDEIISFDEITIDLTSEKYIFSQQNSMFKNIHHIDHNLRSQCEINIRRIEKCPNNCIEHGSKEQCKQEYKRKVDQVCGEDCNCQNKCACGYMPSQSNPYYASKLKRRRAFRNHLKTCIKIENCGKIISCSPTEAVNNHKK
jgi:hypothetical protein